MENNNKKTAIIIGAGPAGITAAYELVNKSDIKPIIYEMDNCIGGIAKTVDYKGFKIDLGPHRFFSKSDDVTKIWLDVLPLQGALTRDDKILERDIPISDLPDAPDPEKEDKVLLYKNRLTRIFFLRKFFDYPISLSLKTLSNLGLIRVFKIGISYISIKIFPIKQEISLEDFFINRFGKELYLTFFKDYTEKVWGVSCKEIPRDWGAQRIKGLSIRTAITHALKKTLYGNKVSSGKVETSLIERFMYPKFGAGQMYTEMGNIVKNKGGEIYFNHKVVGINELDNKIISIKIKNIKTGETDEISGDYFFSSMPVRELINSFNEEIVPDNVKKAANGLAYRDFMTVGILAKKIKIKNETSIKTINNIIPDNWIYVQETDVKIGRLDFFNNFSIYLLKDENLVWLGAEYFCNEGDGLWSKSDEEMSKFAFEELEKIGIIDKKDVMDSIVIRVPKAYPAYFGTYNEFDKIKEFINKFDNLFLVGRNGMHRYNNMDHSMMSAITAVDNIINGIKTKDNIWEINIEEEYHEQKK